METLVVQTGIKHGRVAEITRSEQGRLTIGRGFDNTIVLTDPYVAPRQLDFRCNEGQWSVDVLDETNPVLLNGKVVRGEGIAIDSGDRLTVGRTRLRVFSSDHQIETTHKLFWNSKLHADKVGIFTALSAFLVVSFLDGFFEYVQAAITSETKEYGFSALMLAVVIIVWAGIWSLIGRLLRHQPHFSMQLFTTSLVLGLLVFLNPLITYLDYASSSAMVGEYAAYGVAFIILSLLLKFNLFYATNIKHNTLSAVIVSAMIVMLAYTAVFIRQDTFSTTPTFSATVKAPFAKVRSDQTLDTFLGVVNLTVERLK
ncbi:MAG: FHA domain-containing protein [Sedimenticola sp.]|nr:FHA domain-containing protein [Sedimenticola sp.]